MTGNVPTSQFNRGAFQELYRHYQADFPSTVRSVLQEGVSADARRAGAADGAAGVEDHGDRPAGAGGARRAVRRVPGSRGGGSAEPGGMERQHLLPLRRRSRGRRQGGRHAARRRAAGDHRRAGRALRRRLRRAADARRAAANSGRGSASGLGAIDAQSSAVARARCRAAAHYQANHATRQADVLLALGVRFDDRTSSSWIPGLLLHHPADQAHPCRHRSGGDRPQLSGRARADGRRAHLPAPGAGRARPPQGRRPDAATRARNGSHAIDGYRKEWDEFVAPGFTDDSTPINPQRAAHEIDRALPDDAILVSDIGVHHNWLLQFCKPQAARTR